MDYLIERINPAVLDILNSLEDKYPGTIGELKEYLDTERFWKDCPYYVLECLMVHIYGKDDKSVTESKIEVLFDD